MQIVCQICNGDGYGVEAHHVCGGDIEHCNYFCPEYAQYECECQQCECGRLKASNSLHVDLCDYCKSLIIRADALDQVPENKLKLGEDIAVKKQGKLRGDPGF